MTVRFKGNSEYRRRYKGQATPSKRDSAHQRMRLAGLRSDHSRITREPQFPSKKKVPFYPSRVSNSLQWEGHGASVQHQGKTTPVTPAIRTSSAERQVTPLAPRDPIPAEGTAAPSQQQAEVQTVQRSKATADQSKHRLELNGMNHVLRRKAGLRSERQRNGRLSSEYQRQFMWKNPVTESPLLTAHQMLYSKDGAVPPFKSSPAVMESEYKRNFKGSPPPRPPRLRRDIEQHDVPQPHAENISPEKSTRRKNKEKRLSRKSSPKEEVGHPQPEFQQQDRRSPSVQRDLSPKIMRKVKTEYRSNFQSPLQYSYRDGVWVKVKTAQEEECERNHEWYHEVQELREKAEAYRKRAWGTHFSRQHLNQILSEHNWMWEPSSSMSSSSSTASEGCRSEDSSSVIKALDLARAESVKGSSSPGSSVSIATRRSSTGLPEDPTLPVRRKLAWDEEPGPEERDEAEIPEPREEELLVEKNEWNPKNGHDKHSKKGNIKERNERLQVLENESSSVMEGYRDSNDGGRLPTPKLKTMQVIQRTHHDRTTPATGGALLVSPPKIKNSPRRIRRSEPPLGKPYSPYKHSRDGSPQQALSKAESGSLPRSSPAAGLNTVDPLPMREDACAEDDAGHSHRQNKPLLKLETSYCPKAIVSPHANRIQGTLRNSEFQHNGNLGIFRPELFVFPESDSRVCDNDDKMSQISSRSAASCSMASEVLSRARRRKEEFWGKS